MNHLDFIEKHVREELIRQGFTVTIAQGGHFRPSICTSVCLRQAEKGGFLTMYYVTRSYGQKNKCCQRTGSKRNAQSAVSSRGCSERVKAAVLEHQRLSGAKVESNCEVIMNGLTKQVNIRSY